MNSPRVCFVVLVTVGSLPAAVGAAGPDPKWEAGACRVLADGDATALRELAAGYRKLAPDVRNALPVRIRDDSVEFVFGGHFPGDQYLPESQEYLTASPGHEYETLLVIGPDETTRLHELRPVFEGRPVKGRGQTWSARLVWADGEAPRAIEYSDLLVGMKPEERAAYLDGLAISATPAFGSGTNVSADPGVLPKKRVAARLYLTVKLVPKG